MQRWRRSLPVSCQNGSRSRISWSYSSVMTALCSLANSNHLSNPAGGSRLYRRRYSRTASLSVLDCRLTLVSKASRASAMSLGMGWWIGARGACALARRNLERRTDDEAVVHRWGLVRLEEGKTKLRRTRKVMNAPAMAAIRPRGERSLTTARTILEVVVGGDGEMRRWRR